MKRKLLLDFAGASSSGKSEVMKVVQPTLEGLEVGSVSIVPSISRVLTTWGVKTSEETEIFTQSYISFVNILNIFKSVGKYDVTLTTDLGIRPTSYLMQLKAENILEENLILELVSSHLTFLYLVRNKTFFANVDLFHFYLPIEFSLVEDGVRSVNEEFHQLVDKKILSLYDTFGIPFITLNGTVKERCDKVLKIIKDCL